MFVESLGRFILGIHDQCKDSNLGTSYTLNRIRQKSTAETHPLMRTLHGKTAQERRRDNRIAWQLPGNLQCQRVQRNTRCT